jgi:hypothetical protein
LCVRLDGVDPDGGLLHPACACGLDVSPEAFLRVLSRHEEGHARRSGEALFGP